MNFCHNFNNRILNYVFASNLLKFPDKWTHLRWERFQLVAHNVPESVHRCKFHRAKPHKKNGWIHRERY
jgi:hypothetical protein